MNETHRHIILYAKHWYGEQNFTYNKAQYERQIEDLQYILSIIYGYDYQRHDIWHILVDLLLKYVPVHQQTQYLTNLFMTRGLFSEFGESADFGQSVAGILSSLAIVEVAGNPLMDGLGEPDYVKFPKFSPPKR